MGLTRQEVRERRSQPTAEVQNLVLTISEHCRRLDADYLNGLLLMLEAVQAKRRLSLKILPKHQTQAAALRLISSHQ